MKKQLAIALTAVLLTFPATPGLVMADTTTSSGTGAATTATSQTAATGGAASTSASTNTNVSTTNSTATTPATSTTTTQTTASTTSSAITIPVVDQNGQNVNPGVLPDSPWYWFKTLMEKVQLALTFDPVKKAELTEKQATEDLAEAQALINKGNTEEAEKALTRYNEKIDSAQAFLEQLKDPNSETAQKVQLALTKVNTNNMVVLGSLLEKLPPQAAQRLALNIVRSVEKAVAKEEKMDKKKDQDSTGTTTDASQSASTTTTTPSTNNQAGTTDQAQLTKEAQQALLEFQIALGVKHTPNGYAYGYYKEEKDGEDQKDQEDQEDQTKNSNSNSSAASGQTVQQPPTQVQKQAPTQQQSQKLQPQVNQSGDDTEEKDHNEKEHKENENKSDKEKDHR